MFFKTPAVAGVDAVEAHAWIAAGEAALVDVREADELEAAAVPGATHLPMSHVGVDEYPDFGANKVVVMCRSGVRSARVAAALAARGVEAYNLEGGIVAWIAAGFPAQQQG